MSAGESCTIPKEVFKEPGEYEIHDSLYNFIQHTTITVKESGDDKYYKSREREGGVGGSGRISATGCRGDDDDSDSDSFASSSSFDESDEDDDDHDKMNRSNATAFRRGGGKQLFGVKVATTDNIHNSNSNSNSISGNNNGNASKISTSPSYRVAPQTLNSR